MSKPTMAQEALQAKQQWISVDDDLPKITKKLTTSYSVSEPLLISDGKDWYMGIYQMIENHYKFCFVNHIVYTQNKITHWMLLPELPDNGES